MSNKHRGYGRLPKAGVGLLVAATAISAIPNVASAAGGRPSGAGGGRGGGETTIANNLSNPVYFADNVGILGVLNTGTDGPTATWTGLRIPSGTDGAPQYTEPTYWNGVEVWPQALAGNSWQAKYGANTTPGATKQATFADWGDNILGSNGQVKSFALNTAIRVEVKLTPPPNGQAPVTSGEYQTMTNNGATGSAEKFAADKNSMSPITSATAETIFTGGATMTLTGVTDTSFSRTFPVSVTFVSTTEESGGSTGGVAPMKLAGEVNASGNVVYGLNLFPAQLGMKAGEYRLTFSIAPDFPDAAAGTTYTSGATLNGVAALDQGAGRAEFTAATSSSSASTSVLFAISTTQTGGRGGGGGGTHGGGGGTHGGGVGRG